MESPNPYHSPLSPEILADVRTDVEAVDERWIWREGGLVVTNDGATLLPNCIKCNASERLRWLRVRPYWMPKWYYATFFLGVFPFLLFLAYARREVHLRLAICERHYSQRGWVSMAAALIWLSLAALLVPVLAFEVAGRPWIIGAMVVAAFMTWGVAGHFMRLLSADRIDQKTVWLRGACREYLDQLPSEPGQLSSLE